jgi:large subunit ribosomal protein L21e
MPHKRGFKHGTRNKFTKPFKTNGSIKMHNYLTKHKIGEYVDILVDSAIHKGLPHYFYHGKTGRIFNLNKTSAGVVVNKRVRNRIIPKKMNIRIEHLRISRCRTAFNARIQENDKLKCEAKKNGKIISTKRVVAGPQTEKSIKLDEENVILRSHKPYIDLY